MSLLLLASFDVANFLMGVLQLILEIVYVLLKLTNFIKHDLIVGIRIHFISKQLNRNVQIFGLSVAGTSPLGELPMFWPQPFWGTQWIAQQGIISQINQNLFQGNKSFLLISWRSARSFWCFINIIMKFVLVTLLVTLAFARYTHKAENPRQVLAEINRNHFGNAILSVLQLHLQTGGPVGEIQILLNNIASQLNNDQKKADKVNETDTTAFTKLVEDLEQEIAYHKAQIVALGNLIESTSEALAEAESEVRVVTTDIANNEKSFADESKTREHQHAVWVEKDATHVDQIEAIDEASKIVQHLQAGVAFAQLKSRFEKVAAKLSEGKHALYKPLISALTQLASKVDNKSIIHILELLAQIRQQLVASRASLLASEERQAENWKVQSAHLQEEHKRLSERKQFLENAIVSFKVTIEEAQEDLEDQTRQIFLDDSEDSLAIQQRWNEVQEESYEQQTFEREQQLELIELLQEHITQKLTTTTEFLQTREEVF